MTDPDDLWLEPPQPLAETGTELRPATGYASPFVSITPTGGLTQAPPTPPGILAVTAAHGGAGATTWAHLLGGVWAAVWISDSGLMGFLMLPVLVVGNCSGRRWGIDN